MTPILIEILTIQHCPHAVETFERVALALEAEGTTADIRHIEIDSVERAIEARFVGSPSVRIVGRDIEPEATSREYGLMCRTYRTGETISGAPSIEMIRKAIRA